MINNILIICKIKTKEYKYIIKNYTNYKKYSIVIMQLINRNIFLSKKREEKFSQITSLNAPLITLLKQSRYAI